MFAYESGESFMKSVTFEGIMLDVMAEVSDPMDREIVNDALTLNCLWVDQIEPRRKGNLLSTLYGVLNRQLRDGVHADNQTAILEIEALKKELLDRYPQLIVAR